MVAYSDKNKNNITSIYQYFPLKCRPIFENQKITKYNIGNLSFQHRKLFQCAANLFRQYIILKLERSYFCRYGGIYIQRDKLFGMCFGALSPQHNKPCKF